MNKLWVKHPNHTFLHLTKKPGLLQHSPECCMAEEPRSYYHASTTTRAELSAVFRLIWTTTHIMYNYMTCDACVQCEIAECDREVNARADCNAPHVWSNRNSSLEQMMTHICAKPSAKTNKMTLPSKLFLNHWSLRSNLTDLQSTSKENNIRHWIISRRCHYIPYGHEGGMEMSKRYSDAVVQVLVSGDSFGRSYSVV